MQQNSRRQFMKQLVTSSVVLSAGSWLGSIGYAQTSRRVARVAINQARYRSLLDRRLLGAFLEHLGRAVYTGVYEPGSPLADARGYRKDVIAAVQELGVPMMRYPGGNFVSGCHWQEGVGPRDQRPTVLERAWNSLETNQFGTNEFLEWCKLVGGFLNSLLRQSERVRVGCLAQIVNVIAPLVTNETAVLRQSIYFPYAWALRFAHGKVLDLQVECETYPIKAEGLRADFARNDQVPYLDVVATLNPPDGRVSLFMLNRDLESEREVILDWRDPVPLRVLFSETLTGPDLKAFNTFEQPRQVVPRPLEAPAAGASMTFKLPPRSYTVVQLSTR